MPTVALLCIMILRYPDSHSVIAMDTVVRTVFGCLALKGNHFMEDRFKGLDMC